jgi:hypothetical protein
MPDGSGALPGHEGPQADLEQAQKTQSRTQQLDLLKTPKSELDGKAGRKLWKMALGHQMKWHAQVSGGQLEGDQCELPQTEKGKLLRP